MIQILRDPATHTLFIQEDFTGERQNISHAVAQAVTQHNRLMGDAKQGLIPVPNVLDLVATIYPKNEGGLLQVIEGSKDLMTIFIAPQTGSNSPTARTLNISQ